ncbi:Tex family protein [Lapidilactobacillus salsurivasis]
MQTQAALSYKPAAVATVLTMLNEGNTVPFIARYRKEWTGSLDEVQIREIEATFNRAERLLARRDEVLRSISEQGKLTPALKKALEKANKLQQVEDLYLPFKQKRKSKATVARAQGLAPLAEKIKKQLDLSPEQWQSKAKPYCDPQNGLPDVTAVWSGVHEILADEFGDLATWRQWARNYILTTGSLTAEVKDETADPKGVYRLYYDFTKPLTKVAAHQILAINRGENEGVLRVGINVDSEYILAHFMQLADSRKNYFASEQIKDATVGAYQRFIRPALAREVRGNQKESAGTQAINVFGENLRHLLLQPPLKGKVVLGFDPAYRTGCKLAVVDSTGKFLDKLVIYPHKPASQQQRAAAGPAFLDFLEKYQVTMIAIGNGTASRESEQFVAETIKQSPREIYYVIVNEAGASVYSASDTARAEFPELHVEERSAVSIARRLQDPLAELLKIDPSSVGVGQYQHDVSQKALGERLDTVVEDVVNSVGVNLNTASVDLLRRVSGLSTMLSTYIVAYRNEHGRFNSRAELRNVPRMGPKVYQQAVGFLRISGGTEPLDNTDIHPESYAVAEQILARVHLTKADLGSDKLRHATKSLNVARLSEKYQIGRSTLQDIIKGLTTPGRDLRDDVPAPLLRQDVMAIEDLRPEMILQGTVRNVVDFGAFVDIGVKRDGFVHISQLADHLVNNPSSEVAVGDIVKVKILEVDLERDRISLTMQGLPRD